MSSPQFRDPDGAPGWSDRSGAPSSRRASHRSSGDRPPTVVTGSRRGLTVLGAALIALVGGAIGGFFDVVAFGHLNFLFGVGLVLGCVAAAGRVHEDDLVAVVIMPPLVYALITTAVGVLHPPDGGSGPGLKNKIIDIGSELVFRAPALIAAMGVVIVIASLRARVVRQQRRRREQSSAASGDRRRRPGYDDRSSRDGRRTYDRPPY